MNSILIVQHGHFGQAYQRFASGGPETYRDQRISVDFVAALAPAARVTTLALGDTVYREDLADNLLAEGLDRQRLSASDVARVFETPPPPI